jgi:DNA primase
VWPIRDVTGQTVGFGARRLFDDDQGPKYLNTPETAIYHKSQVLYGLDLAKRDIAKTHRVVVVEGYTDVMACHLAGVTTAIATCGTAFGVDHIKVLRRVLGDDSGLGEVVFTFDGDAAGQQAAMRAFAEEQRFAAQTFVAVAPDGLDPCDLRLARGDAAVRTLVDSRTPLFDFVIRHTLARHDLETVEGRVAALRAAAPIVAEMRDPAMRPGYTRELARMLGVELAEVTRAVRGASSRGSGSAGERGKPAASDSVARSSSTTTATDAPERPFSITDLPNDPSTRLERDALQAMLQYPDTLGPDLLRHAADSRFGNASLAVIRDGIASVLASPDPVVRVDRVMAEVPAPFAGVVQQLAVAPVPQRSEAELAAYVQGVVSALVDRELLRQKAELLGRLQRTDRTDQATFTALQHALVELETERRGLRAE